jgi:hypothetical protein
VSWSSLRISCPGQGWGRKTTTQHIPTSAAPNTRLRPAPGWREELALVAIFPATAARAHEVAHPTAPSSDESPPAAAPPARLLLRPPAVGQPVAAPSPGWYIREYEQQGADRAKYGEALLDRLAERLRSTGLNDLTPRYLRLCRQFAGVYADIWRSVTANSEQTLLPERIWRSLTAKFDLLGSTPAAGAATANLQESAVPAWRVPPHELFTTLSED